MTDLDTTNFKTGTNVSAMEIHTAKFNVSSSTSVSDTILSHPYAHITQPDTVRVGDVSMNWDSNGSENKAMVSSRAYVTDTSFVDFDISLNDGSFNLLIRPQGGSPVAVSEPTEELVVSYVREGRGTGSTHMLTSAGCLPTYTRPSFNQLFRAEETGTISKIKFNEDFIQLGSDVSISICKMDVSGVDTYTVTDISAAVLTNVSIGSSTETFGVTGATDISCITFDASGAGFNVSQNSLYMMTFDGSFCDMGYWGNGMSMLDMSGNETDGYTATDKKPYPLELTVKSTSVSGKTDSGSDMLSTISFNHDISGIRISTTTNASPYINSIHSGDTDSPDTYDVMVGITDVSSSHAPQCAFTLLRIDCCGNDITVRNIRNGEYKNNTVSTKDQLFSQVINEPMLLISYFDTSANEFNLIRCAVDDLLSHPPVFNDAGINPHYQDAVGPNTMQGFAERLEEIGRSTKTKLHTVPYDGVPNSGMRMACDVVEDASNNQWVAYTDLRYATNTNTNVYMVNMSATAPNDTLFHIPLRNPLPKADLSYRYFIATFPTISMCGGDTVNVRHVSVGRNVYAYDTRANTMTFVSADVSVYHADMVAGEASYVGTVDMDGTEMPGFSQYVDLSGGVAGSGGSPHLHYTVTDVSGTAWGAKELKQLIGGVYTPVPLNNHHLFQDDVFYDVSNTVVGVMRCDVGDSSTTTTSSTTFHADVSGNLNVSGDCFANNFVARHTDVNSVVVNHSLWANRVEAASISIGGVELTKERLQALIASL